VARRARRAAQARPGPGARWPQLARVRHPAALPRLGHGRAVALAARSQGPAGRGAAPRRATERTRNPQKCLLVSAEPEAANRTPRSAATARSGGRTSPGSGPPAAGR
jgi:hypothetical protein